MCELQGGVEQERAVEERVALESICGLCIDQHAPATLEGKLRRKGREEGKAEKGEQEGRLWLKRVSGERSRQR